MARHQADTVASKHGRVDGVRGRSKDAGSRRVALVQFPDGRLAAQQLPEHRRVLFDVLGEGQVRRAVAQIGWEEAGRHLRGREAARQSSTHTRTVARRRARAARLRFRELLALAALRRRFAVARRRRLDQSLCS